MSWSAEELAILKARASEGLSSGQIAACIPGKSRNAVIGMLRRGEGKYGALQGQPKNQARGTATPKAEKLVKLKPRPVRDIKGHRAAVKVAPLSEVPPPVSPVELLFTSPDCVGYSKPARVVAAESVANLPAPLPMTFLQAVLSNRCLHYVGDWFGADGPDMPVCGAERSLNVLETRYCRRHLIADRQPRIAA